MVEYLPILIYIGVAISFPVVTFIASRLLRPFRPDSATKYKAYDCGTEPMTEARDRYSVQYYIVSVLFVIFDAETIFLFPCAVKYRQLALFGLLEMSASIAMLVVAYA